MHPSAFIAGNEVPAALLARLHEVDDWSRLRDQLPGLLRRDGYLLLRAALDARQVLQARARSARPTSRAEIPAWRPVRMTAAQVACLNAITAWLRSRASSFWSSARPPFSRLSA